MNRANYYNQPIRSLQTMLQTIGRVDSAYETVLPDGIFGPETMSAVSTFQRNHAYPVTGVANQETWDGIVAHYEGALVELSPAQQLNVRIQAGDSYKKGDQGSNIYLIQSMLHEIAANLNCICQPEITGIMDEATCASVEQLQQLCSLPVTGEVNKVTWKYLVLFYPLAVSLGGT